VNSGPDLGCSEEYTRPRLQWIVDQT